MKGIAFKADMVRAIQEARKSQTRRLALTFTDEHGWAACTTRYSVGEVLWVKEPLYRKDDFVYRAADNTKVKMGEGDRYYREFSPTWPWKNARMGAMYCPRWASRITIKITGVRVERLQDISEDDAKEEGAAFVCSLCNQDLDTDEGGAVHWACDDLDDRSASHKYGYECLWDSINGKKSPWSSNPWVWVYVFEVQR